MWKAKQHDIRISILYDSLRVCVADLCVVDLRSLCLMKIAGDLEISPICGILWSSLLLSLCRSDRGGFWRGQGVSVQVNTKKCARLPSFGILDRVTGMHLFVCVCAGHKLWYLWKLKWSWPPKSLIPTTDSVTCLRWISWLPGNYSLSDS